MTDKRINRLAPIHFLKFKGVLCFLPVMKTTLMSYLGTSYADLPEERYHFPKTYLKQIDPFNYFKSDQEIRGKLTQMNSEEYMEVLL